jgi:hypothetical protein
VAARSGREPPTDKSLFASFSSEKEGSSLPSLSQIYHKTAKIPAHAAGYGADARVH